MRDSSKRIWFGSEEPIFDELPANVIANFRTARSENALLWNTIYKLAQPAIHLQLLLGISQLWGTRGGYPQPEDYLTPYFWGYSVQGQRLEGLEEARATVDGSGPGTEVDLFLVGNKNLIAVEAKHTSGFGRCGRYNKRRCPEIHPERGVEDNCRYWEETQVTFSNMLRIGMRPTGESDSPPCWRHYQLGRTLLHGQHLASLHALTFSLWVIVSNKGWRSLEKNWLDFTDRVRDSSLWRRLRVITWEGLNGAGS